MQNDEHVNVSPNGLLELRIEWSKESSKNKIKKIRNLERQQKEPESNERGWWNKTRRSFHCTDRNVVFVLGSKP
jgi:hypothetical protein